MTATFESEVSGYDQLWPGDIGAGHGLDPHGLHPLLRTVRSHA
jgi:hypothetical protein